MTDQPREIFAWIAKHDNGEENIVMIPFNGSPLPLVDMTERVARIGLHFLKEQDTARMRGQTLRLVKYVEVEVLDTIEP